jgi:hypothetical protein
MSDHEFHDHVVFISPEYEERFKYESPEIQLSIARLIANSIIETEMRLTDQSINDLLKCGDAQILIEYVDGKYVMNILTKEKMFGRKK